MRSNSSGSPVPVGLDALADLLDVDVAGLSAAQTLEVLARFEAQLGWLTSRRAEALRHLAVMTPDPDGSGRGWEREEIMVACQIGPAEAARRLRCAQALDAELPATAGALAAGRIAWAHAEAICEGTRDLPAGGAQLIEREVLADRRAVTAGQYERAARRRAAAMDPAPLITETAQLRQLRDVRTWITREGLGAMSAVLMPEDLAAVTAALAGVGARGGLDDTRSAGQRRADALVEICTTAIGGARTDLWVE